MIFEGVLSSSPTLICNMVTMERHDIAAKRNQRLCLYKKSLVCLNGYNKGYNLSRF